MQSGVRIAFEPLLNINCNSEQTADTARQFLFYDEDMPNPKIPASTVDLDELIDDLVSLRTLNLSLLGSRNLYNLLSAQQHLTQLIRYFIMLSVHESKTLSFVHPLK
jgi:hypothetical protein